MFDCAYCKVLKLSECCLLRQVYFGLLLLLKQNLVKNTRVKVSCHVVKMIYCRIFETKTLEFVVSHKGKSIFARNDNFWIAAVLISKICHCRYYFMSMECLKQPQLWLYILIHISLRKDINWMNMVNYMHVDLVYYWELFQFHPF